MFRPELIAPSVERIIQRSARGKLTMRETDGGGNIVESPTNNQVSLQCELDGGMNTIQFGMIPKANTAANGQVSVAQATILWTVDGNTLRRVVTVGAGGSVSGSAHMVQVIMEDATRTGPAYPAGFDRLYDVSVQVSRGTRANIMQPPILMPNDSSFVEGFALLAGGDDLFLAVPKDSGVVSFQCVVNSPTGAVLPLGSILVKEVANTSTRRMYDPREYGSSWIGLNPSVDEVHVINTNALADTCNVSILWGIDG